MPKILKSLIQSDYGGHHGNFEAVIQEDDRLVHHWRDSTKADLPWKPNEDIVPHGVMGAGSIYQSDFRHADDQGNLHGNFEVVVPLLAADGTHVELWHYWHDSRSTFTSKNWQRDPEPITGAKKVAGPGCIIQSDFRNDGVHGNFEVVVPLFAADGTQELWHFWHDSGDRSLAWHHDPGPIATNVAGPGCIIQSDFRNDGVHGNFEVVVPLFAADGTQELWHFWHDSGDRSLTWYPRVRDALSIRANRIATNVAGPGCIIQSDFRKNGGHGNFEVVVPIGSSLIHFFHDNSDMTGPWQRGQTITEVAGTEGQTVEQVAGWGCIMQSNFGSEEHGNFEVLAEEGRKTVVHYWYPNHDISRPCPDLIVPWMRMAQRQVIVGERDPMHIASTHRVAQLTGEFDVVTGHPTMNKTESRPPHIRGTDLGVSFEHNNQVCFLFGDTWRVNQKPKEQDLDSIAFCSDTEPLVTGLHLTFNSKPPLFRPIYNIDQHAFNVPLDGVSWKGAMYVFFSTCHYNVEQDNPSGNDLMGRSILGHSDNDGLDFDYIGEFSQRKFINVSIEPDLLDEAAAEITRFAVGTPVLWIWGSGRYQASPIYLAVMPLASIEGLLWSVRYFAGGTPWSSNEDDAVPLFGAGDVGELSVRWNPYLARWLALYNSGNPRGIVMHSAPRPWGPWSKDPVMIFDPWKQGGYCHFMHRKWDPDPSSPTGFVPSTQCDNVQDDVLTPGTFRDTEWGGEYGPYQITRFATGKQGESSQIWFTMSTWNPYQVMLMTSTITVDMI